MTLLAAEADRSKLDDRRLVAGAAFQVLASIDDRQDCHPVLRQMANGDWPENVTICVAADEEHMLGLVAIEDDAGANLMRAFAMNLETTLSARDAERTANALMGHVLYTAVVKRREQVVLDSASCMPGTDKCFRNFGFCEAAHGRELKLPMPMSAVVEQVPPYGQGPWVVIVYNDEVTTMDVVINAIRTCVGVTAEVAGFLVSKIHIRGAAEVRRHYFQWTARRTQLRLVKYFKRAGFDTRIEIKLKDSDTSSA